MTDRHDHPRTDAGPQVTFTGIDHAALAARTRRWGWLQYAGYRWISETPFLGSWLAVAFGNPLLYLAAMGLGLGAIVRADVDGVPYLTFVAPGLLAATVVSTGAQFGTWPIYGGFKWQRAYQAAHATPMEPVQMALGETAAIGVRLTLQAVVFWLMAALFGAWPSASSLLVIPAAVLAGVAMFTPLMAYSATVEQEGLQFAFVHRLIVMPMFLFAGTFFPLSLMPPHVQWIGWVSPMWHATQVGRMASYGMENPWWLTAIHLACPLALAVAGQCWATRTFRRRLVGR